MLSGSYLSTGECTRVRGGVHSHVLQSCRYKQTVDTVLMMRDSKHITLKSCVLTLFPRMSEFAPEKFVISYLDPCTQHLLHIMRSGYTKLANEAIESFGKMIKPLACPTSVAELRARLAKYIPDIEREMVDAFSQKKDRAQFCITSMGVSATLAEVWHPLIILCRPVSVFV